MIQNAPEVRHVAGMGVDGESGADFFCEMPSLVMAGGKFDVHTDSLSIGGLVEKEAGRLLGRISMKKHFTPTVSIRDHWLLR